VNAARLARHLAEGWVDPELARALAEHLSDAIEQSVATKYHVETVVTREVQGLRVEMTSSSRACGSSRRTSSPCSSAGCSAGAPSSWSDPARSVALRCGERHGGAPREALLVDR
jgi:hypothetical protein